MNTQHLRLALTLILLSVLHARAAVLYVDVNSTNPVPPYSSWSTAAAVIQDAVDAAAPGDHVLVTNGLYQTGGRPVSGKEFNRVGLTNGVVLQSVNGAQATTITGGVNTRCVYVGSNSVLSGFTLSGGQTKVGGDLIKESSGGGAWCETGGLVSNCLVTGNATPGGAGWGGGVYGGTICSCTLSNNISLYGGAAAAAALLNCLVVSNSTPSDGSGLGGGLYQCTATNCTLAGNVGGNRSGNLTYGGGAYRSTLVNCLLVTNRSNYGGGGAQESLLIDCILSQNRGSSGGTFGGTNYNCVFSQNSGSQGGATYGGLSFNCLLVSNTAAGYGGADGGTLYNCTVVGNVSTNSPGGGVYGATVYNSIVYYNTAPSQSNCSSGCTLVSCCTTPAMGNGGTSSDPSFVDLAGGNFQLQTNSPCINAGNNAYLTKSTDLDGNPRLVAGTVDIGAYEFQNPVSAIDYAWLQRYDIPINAATDTADPDHDGMSNWQEWKASTCPTNVSSVLKVLSPTGDASGILVSWQSVFGKTYYLQRSTNLAALPPFVSIQSNIVGQIGTTPFSDTTATNAGPYFYRVGAQ